MKEEDIRPQKLFNRYLELARQDVEHFFGDRSRFVKVPCPACTSSRSKLAFEKYGFSYLLCIDCESLYVSPRPEPSLMNIYYREAKSVRFWGTDFFKETAEARQKLIFRNRAKLVGEWLEKTQERLGSPRTLVDVGSGYGIFLEEITNMDIFDEVVGIDPAPNLVAISRQRGFRIIEKLAEDVSPGELQASFATAFEVLEHLYDPADFLRAVHDILLPGGVLLFTTLTGSGFDIQVLWEDSKSIYPPHHVNLISIEGMRRLVERCRFELAELTTPGELDVDIVCNIAAETPNICLPRFVRQIIHNRREEVRANFQQFLKANNLSSHVRVVAVRTK